MVEPGRGVWVEAGEGLDTSSEDTEMKRIYTSKILILFFFFFKEAGGGWSRGGGGRSVWEGYMKRIPVK